MLRDKDREVKNYYDALRAFEKWKHLAAAKASLECLISLHKLKGGKAPARLVYEYWEVCDKVKAAAEGDLA
jgi:hypothetical protein